MSKKKQIIIEDKVPLHFQQSRISDYLIIYELFKELLFLSLI